MTNNDLNKHVSSLIKMMRGYDSDTGKEFVGSEKEIAKAFKMVGGSIDHYNDGSWSISSPKGMMSKHFLGHSFMGLDEQQIKKYSRGLSDGIIEVGADHPLSELAKITIQEFTEIRDTEKKAKSAPVSAQQPYPSA